MTTDHSLGPLERSVLQVIWQKKRASVQEVLVALNSGNKQKDLAYTTVMTIMTRLVEKGVLKRTKEGRCYYYNSAEPKETFIHELARKTILSVVNRFGEEALVAFADEAKKLSSVEKQMVLKELQDQQESP